MKQIRPELLEIKKAEESILRRAIPLFVGMIVFTVIFAFVLRYIIVLYGLG